MTSERKLDVKLSALILVTIAYEKKLIDRKTYQSVLKKYGGSFCEK